MPQVRVNKLRMQFDKLKTQTRKLTKSLDGMKTDLRDLEVQSTHPGAQDSPLTRKIRMLENRLDKVTPTSVQLYFRGPTAGDGKPRPLSSLFRAPSEPSFILTVCAVVLLQAMIKYNEAQSIKKTYDQIVKRLRVRP